MEEGQVKLPFIYIMGKNELKTKIKHKIDTKTNWESNNPILLAGEIGIISDTNEFKIGDGVTPFNSLTSIYTNRETIENLISAALEDFSSGNITSITGNAGTATKLQTPRTVTLSRDVSGSFVFDGSSDVTANVVVNKVTGQSVITSKSSIQEILNWLTLVSGGSLS